MTYDNRTEVRKVLIITLLLNVFVMGLKVVVGYWTGSLSLLADALHSVTDSANNVLGLVAIKFSSPLPDREHPYGHNKFEAVGALGIAAFLGIACFEIVQGAVERIIKGGEPVKVSPIELWLLLIVLGVNIFVAFYERNVGRRVGSSILVADATHTMSDVWVTISVIGGLIGVWLGYQLLDVLLAFPVALLVFWSGWSVLKENLPWLVDQMAIAPEIIHTIAVSVPGVLNCHDIASRGVIGRQVFIEMHLIVDARDVETAHIITEEVERQLEERFSPVRILIHVEPPAYQSERITFESE
ncbi:MAG: cation diffusion facilitator family transporter [Dolichospermum sp.]|jgi:cation diffusion facilitator family transporter|uniref:Cation diffusion facilitator family transporter n=2 Tax=Dolichospermum TaxID=748770 RepID=A0ABT5A3P0_9CYAN|nr:cation diffusion facilitator family transporter [Dolichospermum circinale]MCE2720041.1 cation diffusion facilitator family transporter [Anabaena sp. 49628_E55]MDB9454496.1 cation diffusion facilitator family transporter [Dolichospermum circinale CS-541/06]MDB9464504.1 cation diffusion facilitator family transporter [Dolichospermum circinale CS-541/04]MDB9473006.1 cation diffusion facilitator family transporter [Dolichospermum circinale CS-537/11]MDB9478046.1 cation diffusion facilitator fam